MWALMAHLVAVALVHIFLFPLSKRSSLIIPELMIKTETFKVSCTSFRINAVQSNEKFLN